MYFAPVEVSLSADSGQRQIEFYASVFGNRDQQGHRVMPGAFAKTIQERVPAGSVKLFRDHWTHCGVVRHAAEDSVGLRCIGYCSKTPDGDALLEQVADGSLTQCSFRGRIVRATSVIDGEDANGYPIETLELHEIKLLEAGPVDLEPANPLATILGVRKSLDAELLDSLGELPWLLKTIAISRPSGAPPSATERRAARDLLSIYSEIGKSEIALRAMLAPGRGTPLEPPPPTPGQADLEQIAHLLRKRATITT